MKKYTKKQSYWKRFAGIFGVTVVLLFTIGSVSYAENIDELEESTGPAITVPEVVPVSDIYVEEETIEITIDESVQLNAEALPANATDPTIRYHSENPSVAAVDVRGKVTGLATGTANIRLESGDVSKIIVVTVIGAETKEIVLSKSYVVLRLDGSYSLQVGVLPINAPQAVTFRSLHPDIASVSSNGQIYAKKDGYTSVVVSNGYKVAVATVIVNTQFAEASSSNPKTAGEAGTSNSQSPVEGTSVFVLNELKTGKAEISVTQSALPIVSKEVLLALKERGATLTVKASNYTINLQGKDVVNHENELDTYIEFSKEQEDILFSLNKDGKMPGKITVLLTDAEKIPKNLYLYAPQQKKYDKLETGENGQLILDFAGQYRLTDMNLNKTSLNRNILIGVGGVLLVGVIVFLVIRRKYWFW